MRIHNIVTGQKVNPAKSDLARQMRRQPTPEEALVWQHLRANRLESWHFRRQQVIDGWIVDFYCHAAGVVVELDGHYHEENPEYDAERDAILSARGLLVLHFKNVEVWEDLPGVLARIAAACRERAKQRTVPKDRG